jgi:hypothetical protein
MPIKKLIPWAGAAAILTVIFGTIHVIGQQSLRVSANDPQAQMAEDTAAGLNAGLPPTALVTGKVDVATSLAPFVIIYDRSGHVVAGSGYLHGQIPTVPYGVLTHAKPGDDNWVTWQPESGVRLATVEAAANKYYVLSGRSMREVENRENHLLAFVAFGYFVSLVVLGGVYVLAPKTFKK